MILTLYTLLVDAMPVNDSSTHLSLLLERIRQVAIGVREVWLQLDRPAIRVDRQIDEALLIVNARQISMDDCVVGRQV